MIYSVYRAHRSVSNRAEYGFRCVSASAVSLPASAVSERDDDRTEMEIVEFALI